MKVSATEASRRFSDLLSRVAAGETVEVDRHGQVVAVLSPPRPVAITGLALLQVLGRLPMPDDRFADDVRALAALTVPSRDPWRS